MARFTAVLPLALLSVLIGCAGTTAPANLVDPPATTLSSHYPANDALRATLETHDVGGNSPVSRIVANPIHREVQTEAAKPLRAADRLELSGVSHIESGGYETDHKLDAAVDRLLDDLTK